MISRSAGVTPVWPSTTNKIASASCIAISACLRICSINWWEPIDRGSWSFPGPTWVGSKPPVSIISNTLPVHSTSVASLSRVVPGISSTMAIRRSARRLNKVLFPTLGRPTMATTGFCIIYLFGELFIQPRAVTLSRLQFLQSLERYPPRQHLKGGFQLPA